MRAIDVCERVGWPWVARRGLRVRWFDKWSPALDQALSELPDSSECPRPMLAALMNNPSHARKCAALVTRDERPVAVIALRRTGLMRWDAIGGGGVAPRFVAHAVDGHLFPALSALGVNVHVPTQAKQPPEDWVQRITPHTVFAIGITPGFEAYWKASGNWSYIRQARNRTRALDVEIDGPGAAEWIIRGWADRWRTRETASADDLVLAADYYGSIGRFHSLRLLDGGEPVSGCSFLVLNDGLLVVTMFTRPEYRWHGAGTRALDSAFEWAAGAGFKHIDMGVGHDYKRRWAPPSGTRWSFDVRPWHMHASASVARRAVRTGRALAKAARKAASVGSPTIDVG